MHMNIEESGSDNESGCIEHGNLGDSGTPDRLNLAATDDDVGNGIDFPGRIDEPAVFHDEVH